jgi:hypothetical protein
MVVGETRAEGGCGVHTARGSVRDGLAVLQNLETLLRSPKIGPRPLEQVVGELRSSCAPLDLAFCTLIGQIANRDPGVHVVGKLMDFVASRVRELCVALERGSRRDMGARSRLALESDVHRLGGDLGAVQGLVDMLDAATRNSVTELEVDQIIATALARLGVAAGGPAPVRVLVQPLPDAGAVMLDACVATTLVGLLVGLAAVKGARGVVLACVRDGDRRLVLHAHPSASQGRLKGVPCTPPPLIDLSLEVAQLAARLQGASLALDERRSAATLTLPHLAGLRERPGAAPTALGPAL